MIQEFRAILSGVTIATEDIADELYAAGCDDGTVGSSCGVVHIDFDRESDSLESAIESAIDQVTKAGYTVDRIETDEVAIVGRINQHLAGA